MRYKRQELLIGKQNQEKLRNSKITIVGLGAIGSRTAELLTRAGIGSITVIDRDIIEMPNLQTQTTYNEKDINLPKAIALKTHLQEINSEIEIKSYVTDITNENINIINSDLILDCTDNLETRYLINDFSLKNNLPWIYSAAVSDRGFIYNILPNKTPCFSCIFSNINPHLLETCDTSGILNTTASLVSSIQSTQAIMILTKQNPEDSLLHINISSNSITKIKTAKKQDCHACSKDYTYLNRKPAEIIKLCGANSFQIKSKKLDLKLLSQKIKNSKITKYCLISPELIAFKDGRILIKTNSKEKAKSIYSSYIGN